MGSPKADVKGSILFDGCVYTTMVVTVAEQVRPATKQRALQESGNSDELQPELTPQHQSTTDTGDVLISS